MFNYSLNFICFHYYPKWWSDALTSLDEFESVPSLSDHFFDEFYMMIPSLLMIDILLVNCFGN